MSYLARLKGEFSEKPLRSELTKPTKAPSVSFVSGRSSSISENEKAEITNWLRLIGEADPVVFNETLAKCRASPDALRFFLGLARGDDAGPVH